MPNPPPARYDIPWKLAITHAFHDFIAFFFPEVCREIDWSQPQRFRDKELAGIGFSADPDGMVADELIEVHLRDGRIGWLPVHIEIQAQYDASLARRMLDYNYRIFKAYGRPVVSLVLLADGAPNWRPSAFRNEALGVVLSMTFHTAKLRDYVARIDELLASDNPIAWVILVHLRTQQCRHDLERLYVAKWELTKLLCQRGWRQERIIVMFKVINWMMTLPHAYQERYWRAVRRLNKELKMELMNSLEQMFFDNGVKKGLAQGLEQGRERGRKEQAVVLLERQLTKRFGPLSKTARNKLVEASVEQLEAWSDALLEAQSLKQILG